MQETVIHSLNTGVGESDASESARKRSLLMTCLHLIRAGCVMPTMTALYDWAQRADHAHIRYLVLALLQLAQPPYSVAFAVRQDGDDKCNNRNL